jgi:hypothetical protein
MSSHLNNSQRSSVKQRVQKKFNALADVCINEDKMRRDPSKSTNCDEFGEEIIPPPLDVNRAVIPQLLAFYQKVANHWARKNKLKATWNYYQAVYACEYIERKWSSSSDCVTYWAEEEL